MNNSSIPARTRVKICGITRPQDGAAAAAAGADAIGLVFYPVSPRAVTIARALAICAELPPFVARVALFVNASEADIRAVLDQVPIDLLQFHGEETAAECDLYGVPYVKVARVRADFDLGLFTCSYPNACGILTDSYKASVQGGTGATFDWSLLPAGGEKPLILAGGLTATNVAAAIRQVRPYAVDVSGGVETAKGIKDAARIAEFIREVDNVER